MYDIHFLNANFLLQGGMETIGTPFFQKMITEIKQGLSQNDAYTRTSIKMIFFSFRICEVLGNCVTLFAAENYEKKNNNVHKKRLPLSIYAF